MNGYLRKKPYFEAHIGLGTTFGDYFGTYQTAVEALYNCIVRKEKTVNEISYPLLFLVRHSLELGYKANINYLAQYSKLKDKVYWEKHFLKELHQALKKHFNMVIKNLKNDYQVTVAHQEVQEFEKYYTELERLTGIFDTLDRGSYSFRYPVSTAKKGSNVVFAQNVSINLLEIKEFFDKAMILLTYTVDVLSPYTDYIDDIIERLEEE